MRVLVIVWILAGIVLSEISWAQHHDPSWSAKRVLIDKHGEPDSLCNLLQNTGVFEGHIRSFFMSTVNYKHYPDYYAFGIGGGLGYYSPIIKGFQVGLSGFIIFNAASSHLGPVAPYTNRYEIGLFDISNPDNHEDLDRLEDLYLRYYLTKSNKSFVQYGKFHLKTPLINLQDGRMRPNLQEGLWAEWNDSKKINASAGWLHRTSPRSTIHWYSIGKSLVYPNGRAVNGVKADYAGSTNSNGIFITNIGYKPVQQVNYQLWNYYVDNLFNITLNKLELKKKTENKTWIAGVQYLWQKSVYNDTFSIENQYISKGAQSHAISSRIGFSNTRSEEWLLNYTRITKHGRFLFPREWGIEPFYTFMQRERNEGAGDVHAVTAQHARYLGKHKDLSLLIAGGLYSMPSVTDARLNKYTMPSYYQVNVRSRYRFRGFLRGLNLEMLYVYKGNLVNNLYETPVNYHNKTNMHHVSVVMDYYF
jgi:hypothetical protein